MNIINDFITRGSRRIFLGFCSAVILIFPHISSASTTPTGSAVLDIIPKPTVLSSAPTATYTFSSSTKIYYDDTSGCSNSQNNPLSDDAKMLAEGLAALMGVSADSIAIAPGDYSSPADDDIFLGCYRGIYDTRIGDEGYFLGSNIEPYDGHLSIYQNGYNAEYPDRKSGVFYGGQTLLQLLNGHASNPGVVKNGSTFTLQIDQIILDAPAYPIRYTMIDPARRYFPISTIKYVIQRMAEYKLNYLTLHLTDNSAWRVQTTAYPTLHSASSDNTADGFARDEWYSHDEIKEIVAFAEKYHVKVIPEVDAPGHMAAVCEWQLEEGTGDVACLGNNAEFDLPATVDKTHKNYVFYENIMDEYVPLFPTSEIWGIGADEVSRSIAAPNYWQFVDYMARHALKKGKDSFIYSSGKLLDATAVDEYLKQNVTLFVWNHAKDINRMAAIPEVDKIVNISGNFLYHDTNSSWDPQLAYLYNDWEVYKFQDAYNYGNQPYTMSEAYRDKIQGAGLAFWQGGASNGESFEYHIGLLERALPAVAERLWSPVKGSSNYEAFRQRVTNYGTRPTEAEAYVETQPEGPYLVWEGDEIYTGSVIRDATGNMADKVISGGVTYIDTNDKKSGAGSLVSAGAVIEINEPDLQTPWTFSMWVRPFAESRKMYLFSSRNANIYIDSNGLVNMDYYRSGYNLFTGHRTLPGCELPANKWTHLTLVDKENWGVKCYINGDMESFVPNVNRNGTGTGTPSHWTGMGFPLMKFGQGVSPLGELDTTAIFDGQIDKVRLYREELSDEEIRYAASSETLQNPNLAYGLSATTNCAAIYNQPGLTDGVYYYLIPNNYTACDEPNIYYQFDLSGPYAVSSLKLYPYHIGSYTNVRIQTSNDANFANYDEVVVGEVEGSKEGVLVEFPTRVARYVRVYTQGYVDAQGTLHGANHWVEMEIYEAEQQNLLYGKKPVATSEDLTVWNPAFATDGAANYLNHPEVVVEGDRDLIRECSYPEVISGYRAADPASRLKEWVQYDLGRSIELNNIKMWRDFLHGSPTYKDISIKVSDDFDFGSYTEVYNASSKQVDAGGINAFMSNGATANGRYIRFESKLSSTSDRNWFCELQAYANQNNLAVSPHLTYSYSRDYDPAYPDDKYRVQHGRNKTLPYGELVDGRVPGLYPDGQSVGFTMDDLLLDGNGTRWNDVDFDFGDLAGIAEFGIVRVARYPDNSSGAYYSATDVQLYTSSSSCDTASDESFGLLISSPYVPASTSYQDEKWITARANTTSAACLRVRVGKKDSSEFGHEWMFLSEIEIW